MDSALVGQTGRNNLFVVAGESLVDLVSAPRAADGSIHMQAHQGGSPYNCAIALAKLGNDAGYMCPISKDGFGSYLMEPLDAAGVDILLTERVFEPTTLAVVTLNAKGEAEYEFYRGADRALDEAKLIAALPDDLALFQIGGFCPIEPDDAEIWLRVADSAAAQGAVLSMDPNLRPSLIADFGAYVARLDKFLDRVDMVKLSEEDLDALDADKSVEQHAAGLLARPNCGLVIVTLGDQGSRAFTVAGEAHAAIFTPPVFGDTVGAGDSLMAGILSWLGENGYLAKDKLATLDSAQLAEMLRFGAVVAGLNCGRKGCNPPTRPEVELALTSG